MCTSFIQNVNASVSAVWKDPPTRRSYSTQYLREDVIGSRDENLLENSEQWVQTNGPSCALNNLSGVEVCSRPTI